MQSIARLDEIRALLREVLGESKRIPHVSLTVRDFFIETLRNSSF